MKSNKPIKTVVEITPGDATCSYSEACITEAGANLVTQLFERNWDYFVIKKDEATGKLRSFIECCGRALATGE
jgi:hypothetical protein